MNVLVELCAFMGGSNDLVLVQTIHKHNFGFRCGKFAMEVKKLGRYLGPSMNVGEALCGKVLTAKGKKVHRTSIIPLSIEDMNSPGVEARKKMFDTLLAKNLKERIAAMKAGKSPAEIDEELVDKMFDDEDTPRHKNGHRRQTI